MKAVKHQTSTYQFTKIVGFDRKYHQQALHFQNTGTPIRVLNSNEKDDNLFIDNHSTVVKAYSGDIPFQSTKPSTDSPSKSNLPQGSAIQISLNQLSLLTRNTSEWWLLKEPFVQCSCLQTFTSISCSPTVLSSNLILLYSNN